jgi:5-methylcytosine-specific restriction endonuclease McrA
VTSNRSTYNTDRRPSFSPARRATFLVDHGSRCHYCREIIQPWHKWAIDHIIPRQLIGAKSWADDPSNLAPIHDEAEGAFACHKRKSARDVAMIAKSNRVRAKHAEPTPARKPKEKRAKIRSRNNLRKRKPAEAGSTE